MNDDQLRQAYDELLRARKRSGQGQDPLRTDSGRASLDAMLALVERRGSVASRLATLDAAMSDPDSAHELELLRAVAANQPRAGLSRFASAPMLVAAAAAVLLVVAVPLARMPGTAREQPVREVARGAVLLAPALEATRESARVFQWRAVPRARLYSLEILTASGVPVFTTSTADSTVTLPPDVTLAHGTEHRWWVVTQFGDGTEERSELRRLTIR